MMTASQVAARPRTAAVRRGDARTSRVPAGTVMPYDHAATFALTGVPGTMVQDVISIGPEGVFVAVGIGYGLEFERARPLPLFESPSGTIVPADITLAQLPGQALIDGFQVDPRSENMLFLTSPSPLPAGAERDFSNQLVSQELANALLQQLLPVPDLAFMFSMVDSSTGRELQDEPTFSVASLGKSNGERPFRPLARPVFFLPRSTVRMQVIERTPGAVGTLFVVLYGYKIIIGSSCPEPAAQALAAGVPPGLPPPGGRVIPFDYVASFQLTGRAFNRIPDEITISTEGGYVATALGYGLAPPDESIALELTRAPGAVNSSGDVDLAQLPLRAFPSSTLISGIRLRPGFERFAFQSGGLLATVEPGLADRLFTTLSRPEDLSFRYTITDTGSGREWQNKAIHNVAGLGIADGKRPFKKLARPMTFAPRSTIQLTVEEHGGSGILYIVFQGYKILSATGARP